MEQSGRLAKIWTKQVWHWSAKQLAMHRDLAEFVGRAAGSHWSHKYRDSPNKSQLGGFCQRMKNIIVTTAVTLLAGLIFVGILSVYVDHQFKSVGEAIASKHKQEAARLAAEVKARENAERHRKRVVESRERKQAQERAAFDHAWNAYYVTPQDCLVFKSDRHMVECVAAKKKAKQKFMQTYDQAKASPN